MDEYVQGLDDAMARMTTAEAYAALRNPIYEAEYALEEDNPLALFDCLVPKLKEHRVRSHAPQTLEELAKELRLRQQLKAESLEDGKA